MYKLPDWIDLIDWNCVCNDNILSTIQKMYNKDHLY